MSKAVKAAAAAATGVVVVVGITTAELRMTRDWLRGEQTYLAGSYLVQLTVGWHTDGGGSRINACMGPSVHLPVPLRLAPTAYVRC